MKTSKKKEIKIRNYMEDMVKRNMEEQFERRNDVCKCELCKNDIFAYSLNHLPPKYVVTDRGHIFTKLQEMETQFNADVTREVLKAIEFVKKSKRHK
ncbi:MAG: late competence development ComFB family protein [Candidatus Goldbacteria bacterium]|nr:late competence development ComFB family protein [Candidatus Goldiibacteriota bacterium]HPD18304.1 late competence development ComFB family protein [Candidatus Goldiibacteriota bacterium]